MTSKQLIDVLGAQADFNVAARELCQVLHNYETETEDRRGVSLTSWRLETDHVTEIDFLVHDEVVTRISPQNVSNVFDIQSEPLMETDEILADPDVFNSEQEQKLRWSFSIAFNETWACPVIYFTVQKEDCGLLSREELLRVICYQRSAPCSDDDPSQDFVSYAEHPVTATPHFFLHPCRTREMMKDLVGKSGDTLSSSVLLWIWMSHIFSALGFGLPARLYKDIFEVLATQGL